MERGEIWNLSVAVLSIVVAILVIDVYPIAAVCLLLYGVIIGYRTRSPSFQELTERYPLEFFLITTLLLVVALADIVEWI